MDSSSIEIVRGDSRFELRLDGTVVGHVDFTDAGGVRTVPHTEVDPAHRGSGLAARLVADVLRATRAEGLKVDPVCPYVAAFIRRHPEFQDLV